MEVCCICEWPKFIVPIKTLANSICTAMMNWLEEKNEMHKNKQRPGLCVWLVSVAFFQNFTQSRFKQNANAFKFMDVKNILKIFYLLLKEKQIEKKKSLTIRLTGMFCIPFFCFIDFSSLFELNFFLFYLFHYNQTTP